MKKIIFVVLFFAVVIFGIETFHNDTNKWGDFEAIIDIYWDIIK